MKKIFLILLTGVTVLCSCNKNKAPITQTASEYFDIKGYFNQEAARLARKNSKVLKTVGVNGSKETKLMTISDWKKEFSTFSDSEITRASWKGLFTIKRSGNSISYSSVNEKVPVKKLVVFFNNAKVREIRILIKNSNILFTSVDSLTYFPDSLYQVKKQQNITLLSDKTYEVTGLFK